MNNSENYLNHPTFGLLYRVCLVDRDREIYTTLYAQRLFFSVTTTAEGIRFEPISRSETRMLVETRLRKLRREGATEEYEELNLIHQRIFQ